MKTYHITYLERKPATKKMLWLNWFFYILYYLFVICFGLIFIVCCACRVIHKSGIEWALCKKCCAEKYEKVRFGIQKFCWTADLNIESKVWNFYNFEIMNSTLKWTFKKKIVSDIEFQSSGIGWPTLAIIQTIFDFGGVHPSCYNILDFRFWILSRNRRKTPKLKDQKPSKKKLKTLQSKTLNLIEIRPNLMTDKWFNDSHDYYFFTSLILNNLRYLSNNKLKNASNILIWHILSSFFYTLKLFTCVHISTWIRKKEFWCEIKGRKDTKKYKTRISNYRQECDSRGFLILGFFIIKSNVLVFSWINFFHWWNFCGFSLTDIIKLIKMHK